MPPKSTFFSVKYDNHWLFALIASLALLSIFLWYPGIIHDDATAQYMQAMGISAVSDWHPPLMTRFWQFEIFLFKTPYLLNATYILLFWTGIYFILSVQPSKKNLLIALFLFCFPICFVASGWIYKDVLVANLLILSLGIYLKFDLYAENRFKKSILIKSLLVFILLFVSFLRFNAVFITAPLLLFFLLPKKHYSSLNPINLALSLGLVVGVILITPFVDQTLLKAKPDFAITSLEMFDLGGIAFEENPDIDQAHIFQNWTNATTSQKLAACYYPEQWDNFGVWEPSELDYLHNSWDSRLERVENTALGNITQETSECQKLGTEFRAHPKNLQKIWLKNIKNHPKAWFKHRFHHFQNLMGHVGKHHPAHLHALDIDPPGFYALDWKSAHDVRENPGKLMAYIGLKTIRFPFHIFELGSTWLALAFCLFVMTLRPQNIHAKIINCLSFASLMYILGYFFISVGDLLRYFLPSIYLLIIALILIHKTPSPITKSPYLYIGPICCLILFLTSFM